MLVKPFAIAQGPFKRRGSTWLDMSMYELIQVDILSIYGEQQLDKL